ncbi:MAG: hypothetical protein WAU91_17635, partial [Desulfatitalea sp.]
MLTLKGARGYIPYVQIKTRSHGSRAFYNFVKTLPQPTKGGKTMPDATRPLSQEERERFNFLNQENLA